MASLIAIFNFVWCFLRTHDPFMHSCILYFKYHKSYSKLDINTTHNMNSNLNSKNNCQISLSLRLRLRLITMHIIINNFEWTLLGFENCKNVVLCRITYNLQNWLTQFVQSPAQQTQSYPPAVIVLFPSLGIRFTAAQ